MPDRLYTRQAVENTKVDKAICGPCYLVACILIEVTDINKYATKLQLYIYTRRVQTPLPTTELYTGALLHSYKCAENEH